MKTHLRVAVSLLVAFWMAGAAHAQYGVNPRMYEAQSHARWMMQRQAFYGPMGPARAALHQARVVADEAVHTVKQLTGNPDLQHYTRWDRRKLGVLGPYPGGGFGYGMGGVGMGVQPIVQQAPVYGGAALNNGGGARYPTRLNPGSRLFW